MSGLNYRANLLLIESIDDVRNKLLSAYNYAVVHRLQIDQNVEADFNSMCKKISDVSEEMAGYIGLPAHDPCRVDVIENALKVVKQTYEVIHEAENSNDKRIETSNEQTTSLELYGEKLALAAFAAYEAIRNLGAANE